MIEYNKRLVEVDEILSYLSSVDYAKIPEEIIQVIKENKDKDYIWEFDETKKLKDQNLSKDTLAFLAYMNMEYLLNEKQKEYMQKVYDINEQKMFNEQYSNEKKYDYDKLFKRNNEKYETDQVEIEKLLLVEYKKSFFKKIWEKLKEIFRK